MEKDYLGIHIGIIGGGQLGKMMIQEAKKLSFHITVLDPAPDCPAHSICDEHIVADFDDRDAIRHMAEKCDVVTYEFEHIDAQVLTELEGERGAFLHILALPFFTRDGKRKEVIGIQSN